MNLNELKKYYMNSPLWLKKIYSTIPYEIRNGSDYRKWKKFLSQNLNIEEYKLLKLKETVAYAYENVPFYYKTFNKLGIDPSDINDLNNLRNFPLIDKKIIEQKYDDFISKKIKSNKMFYVSTGGSSGKSFKFYQSNNVWKKELAFHRHYLEERFSYCDRDKIASFRGGDFKDLKENAYWIENPIRNEIHFSPFKLSYKSAKYYVEKLNEVKPSFIFGYYSSIKNLISFIKDLKLTLNFVPKAVILISENISNENLIEVYEFFKAEPFSYYAHSERIILAPLANDLSSYQIDYRYGFFDLIDNQGNTIEEENKTGEIIGVSFDNYAMPLIRYRTGDFTKYLDFKNHKIDFVSGRWHQDFIIGFNGERITSAMLNVHSEVFDKVYSYQFIQESIGKVILYLIAGDNFSKEDLESIEKAYKLKFGDSFLFEVNIGQSPILTERGKFKLIYNKLNEAFQ